MAVSVDPDESATWEVPVIERRILTVTATCVAGLLAWVVTAEVAHGKPAPQRCRGADLAGALIDVQGAAGSEFGRVILTNTSSRSCRLKGFARARLIDRNHNALPTDVTRDHSTPAKRVVVQSGAAAAFALRWSNVPSGSAPCRRARWLRVFPPRSSSSVRVRFDAAPCRGALEVRAFTDPSQAT